MYLKTWAKDFEGKTNGNAQQSMKDAVTNKVADILDANGEIISINYSTTAPGGWMIYSVMIIYKVPETE